LGLSQQGLSDQAVQAFTLQAIIFFQFEKGLGGGGGFCGDPEPSPSGNGGIRFRADFFQPAERFFAGMRDSPQLAGCKQHRDKGVDEQALFYCFSHSFWM
jgi:hypothetical protein